MSIRHLNSKNPSDPKWQTVIAKVLPPDTDGRALAILLMDFHVVGKITWKAHEKAAQVYLMHTDLKMTLDEIALYMRTSKTTVQRLLHAHKTMNELFLTMDDGVYEKKGEGAWSFFEELYKAPELRAKTKAEPEFVEDFCRWVGDERLPAGADVRVLPKILKDPVAAKKFTMGPEKTAFQDAKKLVEQNEPEIGSDFFKLLEKDAAGLHERGTGEGDPEDSQRHDRAPAIDRYLRGTCRVHATRGCGPRGDHNQAEEIRLAARIWTPPGDQASGS